MTGLAEGEGAAIKEFVLEAVDARDAVVGATPVRVDDVDEKTVVLRIFDRAALGRREVEALSEAARETFRGRFVLILPESVARLRVRIREVS